MKGITTILKTKLVPPRIKATIIRRPKLIKKLNGIINYPLTLIHSGPGYGKSTMLSSFFQDERMPYCWYTVSNNDDDIIPFLQYVIHALRSRFPSFGEQFLQEITRIEDYIKEDALYTLCTSFVNELHQLAEEIVFVIDDYHLIDHATSIEQWMMLLIDHAPDNFHLVLSSRRRPTWESLTVLKVKDSILEIAESDLSFTEEEIVVLFSDYYEYNLAHDEVKRIYQKTEGWVIALQMIWQQLAAHVPLNNIIDNQTKSMDDLFRFLAMEVLMKQEPRIQKFLLSTCIIDELTGPICIELLESEDAESILDYISHMNLFLFHVGEKQYRYHALFKDFLMQQVKDDPERYVALHRCAAHYYREQLKIEQAIPHLQSIGEVDTIATLLNDYGRTMIDNGKLESLLDIVKGIPRHLKDRYYGLWIYEGDIYRYRSQYEQSLGCYIRGEVAAREHEDKRGESAGLEGQARIYLDTIQPGRADELLQRSIHALDNSDSPDQETQVKLYSLMAENLINLGRAVEAVEWYEKCRQLKAGYEVVELEARMCLRTGQFHAMKKLLERSRQYEHLHMDTHLPRAHRETNLLLSIVHSFSGDPETAKKYAEVGIMQGLQSKAPFVEACGWIRMGHAVQLLPKYNAKMALECYETALRIMEDINIPRGKAEPLMGMCILYGREKSLDQAIKYGELALEETERVKDVWLSACIRLCIAIGYVTSQKWQEAREVFTACQSAFEQCGDRYGLTVLHLWQAYVGFMTKEDSLFEVHMHDMVQMIESYRYEFLLQKRSFFGPRDILTIAPMLIEAVKRGIEMDSVTHLLHEMGLTNLDSHPGYTLKVQTLGEFRVWLGDVEVEEKDWHRGKAKELFQLFVTKHQHLLPREEIMNLLWPDLDEEAANRDFKVALNALNKALEPHRTARSNPFFIQRHGTSYGLFGSIGLVLDILEFETLITAGMDEKNPERASEILLNGLSLYTGDYLPEGRYDDWCIEERERIQVLFLRGAERLAQIHVRLKNFDGAIHWCEEILQKDPCWEEAYRLLIYCFYQKNNRSQAVKWYQRCCDKLEKELGVKPMQETVQMFEMVVG